MLVRTYFRGMWAALERGVPSGTLDRGKDVCGLPVGNDALYRSKIGQPWLASLFLSVLVPVPKLARNRLVISNWKPGFRHIPRRSQPASYFEPGGVKSPPSLEYR